MKVKVFIATVVLALVGGSGVAYACVDHERDIKKASSVSCDCEDDKTSKGDKDDDDKKDKKDKDDGDKKDRDDKDDKDKVAKDDDDKKPVKQVTPVAPVVGVPAPQPVATPTPVAAPAPVPAPAPVATPVSEPVIEEDIYWGK